MIICNRRLPARNDRSESVPSPTINQDTVIPRLYFGCESDTRGQACVAAILTVRSVFAACALAKKAKLWLRLAIGPHFKPRWIKVRRACSAAFRSWVVIDHCWGPVVRTESCGEVIEYLRKLWVLVNDDAASIQCLTYATWCSDRSTIASADFFLIE